MWPRLKELQVYLQARGLQTEAAALAFMSLFAIVPTMTVGYAVLSLIPQLGDFDAQLEDLIFSHFVPSTGRELQGYLVEFAGQARSLTVPGMALLLGTGFFLIRQIERSFNTTWRLAEHRRGWLSLLVYWSIVLFGPAALAVASVMTSFVLSSSLLLEPLGLGFMTGYLVELSPLVASSVAFTALYWGLPNAIVPLRHALIGGFLVALVLMLGARLFAVLVSYSSYAVIYGAFVSIPLFLLWLYIGWMIILLGAELVHYLAEGHYDS